MNYRRGFQRVFAVGAACWLAVCMFGIVMTMNNPVPDYVYISILAVAGIGVPVLEVMYFSFSWSRG
jgi:hypothetical protein